jgi:phosphatidate cytidylyltransferase
MTWFVSVILIIFISIMGQVGDLVASKLKRQFEIKDYSNIFPGHGGVMDRFDSTVFAAMVLMLISKVVGLL